MEVDMFLKLIMTVDLAVISTTLSPSGCCLFAGSLFCSVFFIWTACTEACTVCARSTVRV